MRQQSPAPTPGGGNIYISGRVEGKNFAIGPYARVNVVENHFNAEIGETRLRQMIVRILQEGGTQADHLAALGVSSGVAPLVLRAEQLSPQEPFAPPIGIPPLPSSVQPSDLNRTSAGFAQISQLLGQIDQQIQGGKAQEVSAGGQSLNLGALLLQQGNLDLWRFRQGASRLFAEQASFYALSEPQSPAQPAVQAFQAAARSNVEVLRSWMLFQKYRTRQPALIDQTDWNALNQGRWQAVLDSWVATRRLSSEQAQAERLYLSALGKRYDSQAVQTAAREAEWSFSEVLRRQPDQSAALVNLAALLAESALLAYIETGVADRARLQQARNLFQQAHVLLDHRPDREGQIALAQCLLYEATSLPPDAHLEQVQWAIRQEQQMRATLGQNALGSLRLDIAERNLARRDPSFFDEKKIEQARDILIGAGAMAGLIVLAEQLLGTHTQMGEFLQAGWHAGAGHRLPMPHPGQSGGNAPGPTSSPHASVPGTHPAHGASTMQSAGKAAARGVRHKLLATMHGKMIAGVLATVVVLGASAAVLAVRAHQTPPAGIITEFRLPTPKSGLSAITAGPDGNLWFTEEGTGKIGRITPGGTITEFRLPTPKTSLFAITAGPDGNLWFTEVSGHKIGRITPGGSISEFPLPQGGSPAAITAGSDGNLWFTELNLNGNKIGRITPGGSISEFPLPQGSIPDDITAGPDGNLWFTEASGNKIGRITPGGSVKEFPLPQDSNPTRIAAGPDGNLWFTELGTDTIGRITPGGSISEFPLPTPGSQPGTITAGPDGNLWFTEGGTNKIGRITSGK